MPPTLPKQACDGSWLLRVAQGPGPGFEALQSWPPVQDSVTCSPPQPDCAVACSPPKPDRVFDAGTAQ